MSQEPELNELERPPQPETLGLYLVFAHEPDRPDHGAWRDMVFDTNKYSRASMRAAEEFFKPEVRFVQIINRNSGKVEHEQYKP